MKRIEFLKLMGEASKLASQMYRSGKAEFASWGDALRLAWIKVKFIRNLKDGIVTFKFFKKDGTTRIAEGTRNEKYFNVKGTSRKTNPFKLSFFDKTVGGIRSFNLLFNIS